MWFTGGQREWGQGTRWHNQGVFLTHSFRKKKKKSTDHRKEKSNYFSLPYKWNSRINSQEAPSRASGSVGLTALIWKAGEGLEMCCEHRESTQRFLPTHYTECKHGSHCSLTSHRAPRSRSTAAIQVHRHGFGEPAQRLQFGCGQNKVPPPVERGSGPLTAPNYQLYFSLLTQRHVSGGYGHRKGSTSQMTLLSLCKILPCQQVQQDTSVPREKCLEMGEWRCKALSPMSPKFSHLQLWMGRTPNFTL